jgi:ATP-binding cassette subfamily C (CFTR/MRP) protein 1
MLSSILKAKLQFFESTPIGRILNRFSKDMHIIESVLPPSFENFVYCGLDALTSILVITITTPFFVIVLIPIGIVYFFIQVLSFLIYQFFIMLK